MTETIEVPLSLDLMIPSNVNIENKALRSDITLRQNKKIQEKKALLIEVLITVILD